jgi:Fe-S-cluster containining protein
MWQSLIDEVRQQQALFDEKARASTEDFTAGGGRIYCGRGCRNCCNLAVQCTFTEALAVAEALSDEHAAFLRRHIAHLRQHIREAADLKSYLRLHRQTIGTCPFLEADGACGVYAARPFACRSLLSTRPADWCAVDFAELHPLEKQAYLSSLDPAVVAWPTHYLAAPRDLAQEMEAAAAWQMLDTFGFTLSGNLPFLVWLETEYQLSAVAARGHAATLALLEKEGLNLAFLVSLHHQ